MVKINSYLFILGLSVLLTPACALLHKSNGNKTITEKKVATREEVEYTNTYYNGVKEKVLNNYTQAAVYFKKCVESNPKDPAPQYELASIYFAQGRINEAVSLAKSAFELEPSNDWYALLYAQNLQRKQQYSDAAKVIEKTTRLNPNKPDLKYELASAFLMAGKYNDAVKVYDEIEKENGISEDIIAEKQKIYLKTGNLDKAVGEIKKLIELNPKEPRYYGMLAELFAANGQSEKALEYYNKLLEIDPQNGFVHLSLADYYRSVGNKERSAEELRTAFKSPQVDIDAKMQILLSFYDITEKDNTYKEQALELLAILVNTHPSDAKAYSVQGDYLYREKKVEEARASYLKALELDKEKFVIWNQVILLDSELNDAEGMYLHSKQALELFSTQPNLYLYNGLASMQLKNYQDAIPVLRDGVEMVVDNLPLKGQFYSYLGDCYNVIKDHKNSDECYEKALKFDPKNIYVLNNYAYYLSLRSENLEQAESMSKKVMELEPNIANYEDTYAWVLFKMKKYSEAKEWLEKALLHGGAGNATILEHLGDSWFFIGDTAKALEYWNKAAEKDKGDLLKKKIQNKQYYE